MDEYGITYKLLSSIGVLCNLELSVVTNILKTTSAYKWKKMELLNFKYNIDYWNLIRYLTKLTLGNSMATKIDT